MSGLIVHEWIEERGGSENVLEAIAALFPDADLLTPWNNAPDRFPDRVVRELWLSRSPFRGRKAVAVPILASAWRHAVPLDKHYDWILASSHLFSHHVQPRGFSKGAPKLIYAYTPARYIWTPEMDKRGNGTATRIAAALLRPLDRRRAQEALAVSCISDFVRKRIRAAWRLESTIIYPPVEVTRLQDVEDWSALLSDKEKSTLESLPQQFVLGASRFVPYKRLDLVVEGGERVGMPVVLAGGGPERPRLASQAGAASVPVTIINDPSNALLYALYQRASVFVFPPVEDFGIMPVEAMALGTPVVGNKVGGSAETITEGVSGIHFDSPTAKDIGNAIARAMLLSPDDCRAASRRFSREKFESEFRNWVARSVEKLPHSAISG